MEKQKCILYVRVSSKEQAEKGFSLSAQEQQLRNYFKEYEVVDIIHDKTSGMKRDRDGLKLLQGKLHTIKNGYVCATEMDRLAREPKVQGVIEYWCDQNNVKILTIDTQHGNEFVSEITQVVAKKENNDRIERIRRTKQNCFDNGRHIAKPPLGYVYNKNEKPSKLIQDIHISLIKRMFESRKEGKGYMKIAKELNLRDKNGNLSYIRIKKMLENPFYAGFISYKGEWKKGIHENIISLEEFLNIKGNQKWNFLKDKIKQ